MITLGIPATPDDSNERITPELLTMKPPHKNEMAESLEV
jgi:hypothetical protein